MSKKNVKILSVTALILWMGIIFYFSAQEAVESAGQSRGVLKVIGNIIEAVTGNPMEFSGEGLYAAEKLIRKTAHFFVYFILGMIAVNSVYRFCTRKILWVSECICILYAISDEVHQLFVPGRSGQISDVLLDSVGAMTGILLVAFVYRLFKVRRLK